MHAVMPVLHADFDIVFDAAARSEAIWALMPAARHDCSIKASYAADTSSAVHPEIFLMHSAVAHAYRRPGSDGAACSSLADSVFAADVPTDTLRRPLSWVGSPALAVPQYWHRAAGFMLTLIAHAESRHRVKFAREHVAAPYALAHIIADNVKKAIYFFISLLE